MLPIRALMEERREHHRILTDWWGQCRSCSHWTSPERDDEGTCSNPKSDLHQQVTYPQGECKKWDAYDLDVALQILEEDERARLR